MMIIDENEKCEYTTYQISADRLQFSRMHIK